MDYPMDRLYKWKLWISMYYLNSFSLISVVNVITSLDFHLRSQTIRNYRIFSHYFDYSYILLWISCLYLFVALKCYYKCFHGIRIQECKSELNQIIYKTQLFHILIYSFLICDLWLSCVFWKSYIAPIKSLYNFD